MADTSRSSSRGEVRATAISYARGAAGGLLLATPALMTMEIWWEGFYVPASRLLVLYVVNFGVLFILQHYSGLHHRKTIPGQLRAAVVAYGIGLVVAALLLTALGVLHGRMELRELTGKIMLESIPVSIGASVSMTEFGAEHRVVERRKETVGYWGELGMGLAGASLLGFGLSAVEEPMMIAMQITWKHALLLVAISLTVVYAIVYAVDFKVRPKRERATPWWRRFLRDGVSTYALALVVATYLLWAFEYIGPNTGVVPSIYMIITLGIATSLGAAAGELLI